MINLEQAKRLKVAGVEQGVSKMICLESHIAHVVAFVDRKLEVATISRAMRVPGQTSMYDAYDEKELMEWLRSKGYTLIFDAHAMGYWHLSDMARTYKMIDNADLTEALVLAVEAVGRDAVRLELAVVRESNIYRRRLKKWRWNVDREKMVEVISEELIGYLKFDVNAPILAEKIADRVQKILRETNHPELPAKGEIKFKLHVDGAEAWSWADICNNAQVTNRVSTHIMNYKTKEHKMNGGSANIFCVKLHGDDTRFLPTKSFPSDAGFDLKARAYCRIDDGKIGSEVILEHMPMHISAGERVLVKTGVFLELREGWEAQIRCRSGLALKNGITLTNSPGTVDASYRNEIGVILQNTSKEIFIIAQYDRIAQMVIKEVPEIKLVVATELNTTDRDMGGFGSTGKK